FSSRRRHTRFSRDWSSDVCSSDLNEFGFDYLRDNLATTLANRAQRGRAFAIVDEADSVLIDEARTPLIISGASQDDTSIYPRFEIGRASCRERGWITVVGG